ncbi:hypothetical protein VCHA53O466_40044 [Vibrio chagasii]|nr:hypothetical protein VCHA53O466_40044 [Vibrio chagasii]
MSQLVNNSILFQDITTSFIEKLNEEINNRHSPSLSPDLNQVIGFYEDLDESAKSLIGYSHKDFEIDLYALRDTYHKHHSKPCWSQLRWSIEALRHTQRLEVMVVRAMCESLVKAKGSNEEPVGGWMSKFTSVIRGR